ncbi:MAG TPA: GGDEF domain-containing protein [Rubrivivax sp.]|nr:GGDEF domain-containing protein [Rubrivivax sp.]
MNTPAILAKGALRRLAQAQQEPTPENYARAYAEESGQPPAAAGATSESAMADAKAQGAAWATLVERLARNLERGGKQWTGARRKESLKRVLEGSRSDAVRLLQRLQSLMTAWESDQPSDAAQTGAEDPPVDAPSAHVDGSAAAWPAVATALEGTVRAGLAQAEPRAAELAARLSALADGLASEGATPERAAQIDAVCQQARRLFVHRHHLIDELGRLCHELGAGITELAEDDSWARGQCQNLQARLGEMQEGVSVRSVRAASALLAETRQQQQQVRGQRQAARDALKQLLHDMLHEVDVLGEHAGRFESATSRHAEAIAGADSLDTLAGAVKALLEDTRVVQSAVQQSQNRLAADRAHATELESKVRELEGELRRLSDEVSTDALTQVANRRGLAQAFEAEVGRAQRAEDGAASLAVALIDIDNFKKLNDSLGHAAGDQAQKSLAAAVCERLRPVDHLARFGGEEFVVLLPGTPVEEAQAVLTRLQRSLSEALFLHENREVFVTFSAGVTPWQAGEALETALERADEALYEAKRTGKNRTCMA